MHNNRNRGPIQKRILLITLSAILSICILISLVSYYIFNNYLRDEQFNTSRTNLLNLSESIDKNIENVYRFARYCQGSSDIADYVMDSSRPKSSVSTYARLYEEYQINEASNLIPRACIISGDKYLQVCLTTYSTTVDIADAVTKLDFFDTLIEADDYIYPLGIIEDPFMRKGSSNKLVVPIIRPITYKFNSDQSGILYMEFSDELFLSQMSHYYMEEGSLLYLVMNDHIYRYENDELIEDNSEFNDISVNIKAFNSGTGDSSNNNIFTRANYVTVPLSMKDCYLVQTLSPFSIWSVQGQFLLLFFVILILVIMIGVIIHSSLDRYIMKPLIQLRKRIELTSSGDFSVDPTIEWNHELGEIGHGINELAESVQNLLEKRLEDEKQKRDLEYKMLQSQINPHFLYNTLNSIKMMATIQGAKGISDMTTALASLLRSISKGTSLLIPIEEELKLINDYFTIQNYRYGGMIQLHMNVSDEDINKYSILKFTLQPLVENAIFHGLEPKGGTGTVDINVYMNEQKDICIEVTDDGIGMTKEQAERILAENATAKAEFFKEIGVSNVNKRLQYEFGDGYGISIDSELGSFTTMRVTIPPIIYDASKL